MKSNKMLVRALAGVRNMGASLTLALLSLVILDNFVTYNLYIRDNRENQ